MTHHDDMDYRALFGGRYLSAPDLPVEGRTVKIHACGVEDVEDPKTKLVKARLVVHFTDPSVKPWLPCRTAAGCLAALWGDRTGGWAGRAVTLHQDPTVKVGAKVVGGIRVLGAPDLPEPRDVSVHLGARKPPARCRLIPTSDPLATMLSSLNATPDALTAALAALPKPLPVPTDREGRGKLAAALGRDWAGVATKIRGSAQSPTTDQTPDHHEEAGQSAGEE
jgi:hypothetical protein